MATWNVAVVQYQVVDMGEFEMLDVLDDWLVVRFLRGRNLGGKSPRQVLRELKTAESMEQVRRG